MAPSCSSSSASVCEADEGAEERARTGLLSDDTLILILRRIPTRELLSSLAFVCRRWRRLCSAFGVYELVPSPFGTREKHWGNLSMKKVLELTRTHASTLERVHLRGVTRDSHRRQIEVVVENLPRLRDFSVLSSPLLIEEVVSLAKHLPTQLLRFELDSSHGACMLCENNRFHMFATTSIDDGILRSVYERCPRLQHLTISSYSSITHVGLEGLLRACKSLTSLDLHSHALDWPDIAKVFTSCKSLTHFSLVSRQLIRASSSTYDDGRTVGFGRGSGGQRAVNARLRDDSDARSLAAVVPKDLISIRLCSYPHRSVPLEVQPMFGILRSSGHQLQRLHAQRVFNTSWHAISVWCGNLRVLDLSHGRDESLILTKLEEIVLCGLFRSSKKLERIALPAATDHVLSELGQFCPNLREIRFQGYHGSKVVPTESKAVTDRGVVAVAEGCPALRVLSLAGCSNVTISSARALAFHCRQLKVLVLSGCANFEDDAVAALLPRLNSSLLFLDLVGCKITRTTLRAISQYAQVTSLRVVAIPNSLWLKSQSVITDIQRSNPRVKIRSMSGIVWDGFCRGTSWDVDPLC